jgi:glycosyltransferase involved in cell wall biosynthesis
MTGSVTAPPVDVVIATRDRPELLRTAIRAVLEQDYDGDIRIFVVFDQHPADHSLGVDDDHRGVTVLDNTRTPGLAGARNAGIVAGSAPIVALCDDDDRWLPGKLRAQIEAMESDPGAVLASTGIRVRYGDVITDRFLPQRTVGLRDLLRSRLMELHPSTFVLRREALDRMGLVAEDIPGSYAEDYEFLLRAARHGRILSLPVLGAEILWHRRSYFTARWATIAEALAWLLDRYPEFASVPRGHARILGQIAFAEAARGRRAAACRTVIRTLRIAPREPRAWLALAVALGLSPDFLLGTLQRRGRSI